MESRPPCCIRAVDLFFNLQNTRRYDLGHYGGFNKVLLVQQSIIIFNIFVHLDIFRCTEALNRYNKTSNYRSLCSVTAMITFLFFRFKYHLFWYMWGYENMYCLRHTEKGLSRFSCICFVGVDVVVVVVVVGGGVLTSTYPFPRSLA